MRVGGKIVTPFDPWKYTVKHYKEDDYLMLNHETFLDYFYRLQEIALNRFTWDNLPETIDPRFLELTLCDYGSAVYFRDDVLGDLTLTVMPQGKLNVYRIPTTRVAYAWNGFHQELTDKDSVLIWNNYLHTPTSPTLILFAMRLAQIERTMDVNVSAQKTPVLLICDDKQRLTLENVYSKYSNNAVKIFGDKSLQDTKIQAISTEAPFIADKLETLKKNIWNEAMSYLGVSNGNTEKKERQVSTEVISSQGTVAAQRVVALKSRQEAAAAINKMFGTNITVCFNPEIEQLLSASITDTDSGMDWKEGEGIG